MAGETAVRPARPGDREAWEPLWRAYLTFYEASLASNVTDPPWRRFFCSLQPPRALLGARIGRLVGLAAFLFARAALERGVLSYLQLFFFLPAAPRNGVAR